MDPSSSRTFKNTPPHQGGNAGGAESSQRNRQFGEIEELEDDVETKFKLFKNFEVLSDCPPFDHLLSAHKLYSPDSVAPGTQFHQKIEQEWSLLQRRLPKSTFVRAYEESIDLMRAVIIGPQGTPYNDALFFFDIFFPNNYPSCPPKVLYHSYGMKLNPDLDSFGKVSLGILGTSRCGRFLNGSDNNRGKWNPQKSSVLDVLIAIEEKILNPEPISDGDSMCSYLWKAVEWKMNKKNTFMLTRRMMISMLINIPLHFEDFVTGYFRTNANKILLPLRNSIHGSEEMTSLFFDLIDAFERNGAYCKHHLVGLTRPEKPPQQEQSEDSSGFLAKTMSKLRIFSDCINFWNEAGLPTPTTISDSI